MGFIYGFLIVLEAIVSALLIAIIFMQKSKGGMGGSAFGGGGGEAIFGSRMGNVLTKATVVLGSVFLINTIVLTILTARQGPSSVMDRDIGEAAPVSAPVQQQPMAPVSLPEGNVPMVSDFGGEGAPVVQLNAESEVPVTIPSEVPSAPLVEIPTVEVPAAQPAVEPAAEPAPDAPVAE